MNAWIPSIKLDIRGGKLSDIIVIQGCTNSRIYQASRGRKVSRPLIIDARSHCRMFISYMILGEKRTRYLSKASNWVDIYIYIQSLETFVLYHSLVGKLYWDTKGEEKPSSSRSYRNINYMQYGSISVQASMFSVKDKYLVNLFWIYS